jgi:hypothetical protein
MVWMLILACLGICSYFLKSQEVFPSASIDLKSSRSEILRLSDNWAREIGYQPDGAIKSTVFNYDDEGKTFLEHELGLTEANALMKDKVPIWYWSTRLCRPFKLDEFTTAISPSGKITSFDHSIENDKELPSIAHDQARAMASKFVEQKIGLSLSGYKSVEDGSTAQPHRTDHYFTWEDTKEDFKGAHLRTYIYISGNTVTAYNHFLYIPESWIRKFSEMRSYNKALEEVASVFYVIFNAATFFAFIWMFTRGAIRWKVSLVLAGLVAIMDYLESINSMPNMIRNYTTTMSYNGYVLDIYISALWSALAQFLQTLMLAGAAEALYRLGAPAKVALEHTLSKLGLRTKQVITGLVAGHALFGIHLGWVIMYYLLGEPLHFWSPLEVRNVESLSTVVPAFSAANVGVTAAVTEELTYRVLGMTIFQKLVKNFWIANLLQAAAWAFMHSNYPQEPAYARGVELTAVGFLYGFILRRFGLLPCIISHYVFDTFLGVTPLMSASSAGLQVSAYLAVAPFLLILAGGAWLVKRKGWMNDERLANDTIALKSTSAEAVEEIFPHTPYRYQPLARKTRTILAVIAIAATAIEFGFFFPTIGLDAKLSISREAAIERARTYMIDHKVPPMARMETAQLVRNVGGQELTEFQYLFEKMGFAKTAQLANSPCHQPVWLVKFFKPLDPEEYTVTLDAQGTPVSLDITRAEDAPGARLTEAQARKLVETYLRVEHSELKNWVFESARSEERKARTDYKFTYKVPEFNAPGADFKVNIRVVGDLVSGFEQYWNLPDKWLFDLRKETTRDQVCGYVVAAVALGILVAIIWWIIGVARSGAIHWRGPIFFGLAMSLLVIPQSLNDLAEFYANYSTETPLLNYFVAQCVRQILTAVQMIGMAVGLGAFSLASFRLLFPRLSAAGILRAGMTDDGFGGASRRDFWLDAILSGYAFGLGSRALLVIYAAIHAKISPVVTLAPLESLTTYANVLSPALDSLMDGLTRGVQALLMSGILAGIYAKYFRSVRGFILFAVTVSLIYPSTDRYWQDYLIDALNYLMYFAGTWLFLKKVARQNLLAYFLAGAASMIAGSLRVLIAHGSYLFVQDIAILAVVLLSPLIYFAYLNSRSRPPQAVPAQPAEVGEYVQG